MSIDTPIEHKLEDLRNSDAILFTKLSNELQTCADTNTILTAQLQACMNKPEPLGPYLCTFLGILIGLALRSLISIVSKWSHT